MNSLFLSFVKLLFWVYKLLFDVIKAYEIKELKLNIININKNIL